MTKKWIGLCLSAGVLLLAATVALAAEQGYSLAWWTVDSGGGRSAGGSYHLDSASGQPEAGRLLGGDFVLTGGFFANAASLTLPDERLFLPMIVR
jgi:hypothetical protein